MENACDREMALWTLFTVTIAYSSWVRHFFWIPGRCGKLYHAWRHQSVLRQKGALCQGFMEWHSPCPCILQGPVLHRNVFCTTATDCRRTRSHKPSIPLRGVSERARAYRCAATFPKYVQGSHQQQQPRPLRRRRLCPRCRGAQP